MEKTQPDTLVIERPTWVRGDNRLEYGTSALLNGLGRMCCLGFDAKACGVDPDEMESIEYPMDLDEDATKIPEYYKATRILSNEDAIYDIAHINDDPGLTESEREANIRAKLIEVFGYTDVVFVD
jgi:hypothetical protein